MPTLRSTHILAVASLLSAVCGATWPESARAQTPLEDGTDANAWVYDPTLGLSWTFRVGTGPSSSATSTPAGVVVTTAGPTTTLLPGTDTSSEVMVNDLRQSYPKPTLLPPLSVRSLGAAVANTATPTLPSIELSGTIGGTVDVAAYPNGTTVDTSVRITARARSGPAGVPANVRLYVKVGADPEVLASDAEATVLLVRDGTHTVVFRATDGPAQVVLSQTWVLTGGAVTRRDSDGDGMPDLAEATYGLDPFAADTRRDTDGDGWSDLDELLRGTSPNDAASVPADTDGDGWSDWDEDLRGTDEALASSRPVAASIADVEYLVTLRVWDDVDQLEPAAELGYGLIADLRANVLAALSAGPLTTAAPDPTSAGLPWATLADHYAPASRDELGVARVPGDGALIALSRVDDLAPTVLKAHLMGSPAASPALLGPTITDWNPASTGGWLEAYEDALAAYLVQEREVDLDPHSGLVAALWEAAAAWVEGVTLAPPILLGEVAHTALLDTSVLEDLEAFAMSADYQVAVDPAGLATELFAPPADGETSTGATARRLQLEAGPLATILRYQARLVAFVGRDVARAFRPYDTSDAASPWLPDGDADQDGLTNTAELTAGPDHATDPLYPDSDDDGLGDLADPCPRDPSDGCLEDLDFATDLDRDGVLDALDNCFGVPNPTQLDTNRDGIGDACEAPARIALPVANTTVLAPRTVHFAAQPSAAAAGPVSYRWTWNGNPGPSTRTFDLEVPLQAGAYDIIVRLYAKDGAGAELETDRRVVRVLVDDGPVPCLAVVCDDRDPCTLDRCDLAQGCVFEPIAGCLGCALDADCADANACTSEACVGGVCEATPLTGTACDDGNACTDEQCDAGQCRTRPHDCTDADPCTVESCDPASGCVIAPDPTPDPILCPECTEDADCGADTCLGGACCEATIAADGVARVWNPGEAPPTLCLTGGTELHIRATSANNVSFRLRDAGDVDVMNSGFASKDEQVERESLPADGQYRLVFSGTAAVTYTVTESEDVSGTLSYATQATVTTTRVGSEASLTFEGEAGKKVSILASMGGGECDTFSLTAPSGAVVFNALECAATDYNERVLAETGTYTLAVDPGGLAVGNFTATMWEVPPQSETASAFDGVKRSGTLTIPGSTHAFLLDGVVGQRVSILMQFAAGTYSGCWYWTLFAPSGAVARARTLYCGNGFTDSLRLAETGTYVLVADGNDAATATVSATAWTVPEDLVLQGAIGGGATTLALTTPALNGNVDFAAVAGDVISVTFGGVAACADYTLFDPNGVTLTTTFTCGTPFFDRRILATTGTHRIEVDLDSASTDTLTVTVHRVPADVTATLTIGAAATPLTTTVPGQNVAPTFSGVAGQSIVYAVSMGPSLTHDTRLFAPDGSIVHSVDADVGSYTSPAIVLPADGVYTVWTSHRGSTLQTINVLVRTP